MKTFLVLWGLIVSGVASQYGPGIMDEVIFNRQNGHAWVSLPIELPSVDGYIAARDCAELGHVWQVRRAGTGQWSRFLVVDCAGPQLRPDGLTGGQWMKANNIMLEIDHDTAVRWNTVGLGIEIERLITLEDLRP